MITEQVLATARARMPQDGATILDPVYDSTGRRVGSWRRTPVWSARFGMYLGYSLEYETWDAGRAARLAAYVASRAAI